MDKIITHSNRYFFKDSFVKNLFSLPISVCFHGFVPEQIFQRAVDYKRSSTTDTAVQWHQRCKKCLYKFTMSNSTVEQTFFWG